ncbi:MAG TPA: sulfite exporter TauE/SafE family protein [Alphaproteobacteria bacterium]|nr:sulfite exporter TauE/SafE family protein [Alphaproteobacteria bacterium]
MMDFLASTLNAALAHCAGFAAGPGSALSVGGAMLAAGLVGGVTHCTFMCGPFVLSQMTRRLESIRPEDMSEAARLKSALLVPYHLGRITTYTVLGALAGGLIGGLSAGLTNISGMVLLLAGLTFLASALPVQWPRWRPPESLLRLQDQVLHFVAPLALSPLGARGFILGIVLGFLPCPMIWSGLLAAAGTGSAGKGGFVMACLALGTVPGLAMAAFAGHSFLQAFRIRAERAAKVAMALAGAWLCVVSIGLLAGPE